MKAQIGLEVYKSDLLSRLPSLLICFWILASLKHFCKCSFNGSCAVFFVFFDFQTDFFYSQSLAISQVLPAISFGNHLLF